MEVEISKAMDEQVSDEKLSSYSLLSWVHSNDFVLVSVHDGSVETRIEQQKYTHIDSIILL